MTKKAKIILSITILLLVTGIVIYPLLSGKTDETSISTPANTAKRPPLNVNAQVVKYEDLDDSFLGVGNIIPDEEVDLSFETSGKIMKIYFKEGTAVEQGQLLAKINDLPLQAELKKLQTQVKLAEDKVYRQKMLLAKDAVSKEAYEQAATELDKLNADIELAKAYIAQTELRAPFTGIIGLRLISEGQYASPSTIIAKLTKIIPLKIEFSVNERQSDMIRNGTKVKFKVQDDLNNYEATVYAIESKIDLNTHTLKVRAIYPNSNGKLKPGKSVSIAIQTQKMRNTLTVPSEAIIAEMGQDIAYVYRNGKAEIVTLKKGLRTESKVQIVEGLKAGDTLITSGVMQLKSGMPVTVTINNVSIL